MRFGECGIVREGSRQPWVQGLHFHKRRQQWTAGYRVVLVLGFYLLFLVLLIGNVIVKRRKNKKPKAKLKIVK